MSRRLLLTYDVTKFKLFVKCWISVLSIENHGFSKIKLLVDKTSTRNRHNSRVLEFPPTKTHKKHRVGGVPSESRLA